MTEYEERCISILRGQTSTHSFENWLYENYEMFENLSVKRFRSEN
jgi:hypothetical protein